MDSPLRSRKQLMLPRKKENSLPANLRWSFNQNVAKDASFSWFDGCDSSSPNTTKLYRSSSMCNFHQTSVKCRQVGRDLTALPSLRRINTSQNEDGGVKVQNIQSVEKGLILQTNSNVKHSPVVNKYIKKSNETIKLCDRKHENKMVANSDEDTAKLYETEVKIVNEIAVSKVPLTRTWKRFLYYVIIFLAGLKIGEWMKNGSVKLDLNVQKCNFKSQFDSGAFELELKENFFGQHIAKDIIIKSVSQYMESADDSHPLVLVMTGGTGVGKNHLSNLISSTLNLQSVPKIIVTLHYPHLDESDTHFYQVQDMIEQNLKLCQKNLFIIDEMDKASSGLTFGLITAINKVNALTKNKNTKVIFLILSNSYGKEISGIVYQEMLNGRKRESLQYNEMQGIFTSLTHRVTWYESMKEAGIINYTIPFLPLEKEHVHECISKDLLIKSIPVTQHLVEKISQEMVFFPEDTQLFSKTGCRRVPDKVNMFIPALDSKNRNNGK